MDEKTIHTRRDKKRTLATCHGYTIVEMVVSIGIFSLAFVAVSAIFVGFTNAQARASTSQKLLNEGNYLLNTIASDIRKNTIMYTSTVPTDCPPTAAADRICLKTYDGYYLRYDFSSGTLKVCKSFIETDCNFNSANWVAKATTNLTITKMKFFVFPKISPSVSTPFKPGATIMMTVTAGSGRAAQTYSLQTSVVSRMYPF